MGEVDWAEAEVGHSTSPIEGGESLVSDEGSGEREKEAIRRGKPSMGGEAAEQGM
jgi:hypothetical protein